MIPAMVNHLWQSTGFAAGAVVLALAFRRLGAQVRYRIWLAASLKFLVPLSAALLLGGQFEWRTAPEAAPALSTAIVRIAAPAADASATAAIPHRDWVPAVIAVLWFAGFVAVAVRWWMRWRVVRTATGRAVALPIAAPVPVLSSHARLEPGIFGIFRPVLLLPEGLMERLTPAQFAAILAHELCHVRRRDNLAAAVHMVVEAIFWFHPLVWWIGARMIEERERACDEEVLRLGCEREAYAAGILSVCRCYLESPLPCASGVTGADLRKRVQDIMTAPVLRQLSLGGRFVLAGAMMAALAVPVVIGIAKAQTQASLLRFEVATIKPAKNSGGRGGLEVYPGGELRMDGATLRSLVAFAYDVREEYVIGGPKWVGSDAYNLVAKPERATAADNPQSVMAPGTTAWDRMRLRLQTLLAERFQLVVHKDGKEASGYVLVVAKGGVKMKPSTAQEPAGTMRDMGHITGRSGTMHMLAAVLEGYLRRPVVDRTGLTEAYSYKLEYAQEAADGTVVDAAGPDIFRALQDQLGLKLESGKVTTETIVIERAEKASAN